jgi:hypothetical protein
MELFSYIFSQSVHYHYIEWVLIFVSCYFAVTIYDVYEVFGGVFQVF